MDMQRTPQFDEGYHGDTTSQPGSEEGTMTPPPGAGPPVLHAQEKATMLQASDEERRQMVLMLCQSLPNAIRLALLNDIGAMVFHDPVPKLPNELMLHILSHLSPRDLLTSSAVSRPWRERSTDQQLWRDCFVREGWVVDRVKMLGSEELAKKKGAKVAERIMRTRSSGRPDRAQKPGMARRDSRKRPREEAFSEGESSASTVRHASGTLEESREMYGPMEGVESTDLTRIARGAGGDGVDAAGGCSDDSDVDSIPGLQIKTAVFSDAAEPKLSWSYLYKQRRRLESNWDNGNYTTFRIPHPKHEYEGHTECVYAIQHHGNAMVSGSRDKSIRIWDLSTCRLKNTLLGHEASVLCLQFDPRPGEDRDVIISGGSDNFVIVWRYSTGKIIKKIKAHNESVLNLRFDDRYLITCSKDKTIRIWNRHAITADDPLVPTRVLSQFHQQFNGRMLHPYSHLDTLVGHQAAVNAVQINGNVIVSASGDRTIKSWDLLASSHRKSYSGHSKGIACVQFDGRRIVSGSSDNSVRIFDYETTAEVACLEGHHSLVRTVQARFGDLNTTTDEELLEQSREADKNFFLKKLDTYGEAPQASGSNRPRNAGSSRPEDMLSFGTNVPPGGGGSKWGRIVSGSYDESVIIWKRHKDGKWKPNLRLNQSEAQSSGRSSATTVLSQPAPVGAQQLNALQQAHHVLQQATFIGTGPAQQGNAAPTAISTALAATQQNVNAHIPTLQHQQNNNAPAAPTTQPGQGHAPAAPPAAAPAAPQGQAGGAHAHHIHHHHHHHAGRAETNRVFKLQFDARRIISCSQNKVVVGWDFANGDKDLEWIGDWSQETA